MDDDVIGEPDVSKVNVVDVESDKDKAKHAYPALYPHRLRIPKNSQVQWEQSSLNVTKHQKPKIDAVWDRP